MDILNVFASLIIGSIVICIGNVVFVGSVSLLVGSASLLILWLCAKVFHRKCEMRRSALKSYAFPVISTPLAVIIAMGVGTIPPDGAERLWVFGSILLASQVGFFLLKDVQEYLKKKQAVFFSLGLLVHYELSLGYFTEFSPLTPTIPPPIPFISLAIFLSLFLFSQSRENMFCHRSLRTAIVLAQWAIVMIIGVLMLLHFAKRMEIPVSEYSLYRSVLWDGEVSNPAFLGQRFYTHPPYMLHPFIYWLFNSVTVSTVGLFATVKTMIQRQSRGRILVELLPMIVYIVLMILLVEYAPRSFG